MRKLLAILAMTMAAGGVSACVHLDEDDDAEVEIEADDDEIEIEADDDDAEIDIDG